MRSNIRGEMPMDWDNYEVLLNSSMNEIEKYGFFSRVVVEILPKKENKIHL